MSTTLLIRQSSTTLFNVHSTILFFFLFVFIRSFSVICFGERGCAHGIFRTVFFVLPAIFLPSSSVSFSSFHFALSYQSSPKRIPMHSTVFWIYQHTVVSITQSVCSSMHLMIQFQFKRYLVIVDDHNRRTLAGVVPQNSLQSRPYSRMHLDDALRRFSYILKL